MHSFRLYYHSPRLDSVTVPDLIIGSWGTNEQALSLWSVSLQWGRTACWHGVHDSGHSPDWEGRGNSPEQETLS